MNFQNHPGRKTTACVMFPRKPVTHLIEMSHAIPTQYLLIGTLKTYNVSYKSIHSQKYSCFQQSTKTDLITQNTFAFKTVCLVAISLHFCSVIDRYSNAILYYSFKLGHSFLDALLIYLLSSIPLIRQNCLKKLICCSCYFFIMIILKEFKTVRFSSVN